MHTKDNAADQLEQYWQRGTYGHAANIAQLVVETLPNGQVAWLRSKDALEDDDALYTITERGRDYLARLDAERALFGEDRS